MTSIPEGWFVGICSRRGLLWCSCLPMVCLCGVLWVLGSFCVSGFVLVPAWWPLFDFG